MLTFLSKPLETKKVPAFFGCGGAWELSVADNVPLPFCIAESVSAGAEEKVLEPLNQRRSDTTPLCAPTPPVPRTMRTSQHFTQPSAEPESTRWPSAPQSSA